MRLVFDIETDGLLDSVTKIWLLVTIDLDTKELKAYSDSDAELRPLSEGLFALTYADTLIGHNIISYDIPVIRKLYPMLNLDANLIDTLNLSRLVFPSFAEIDARFIHNKRLPSKLFNRHSLKAWGYRVNYWKGDFEDWSKYSREMLEYCKRDVKLNVKVYNKCMSKEPTDMSIKLEMDFQKVIFQQERTGVPFNTERATTIKNNLLRDKEQVKQDIYGHVSTHTTYKEFTPKRDNAKKKWIAGVTITREKTVPFNPGSRTQIISYLQRKYEWKPLKLTDKNNPSVDDDVLEGLTYREAPLFRKYFQINKLLGQLSEGPKGWLKFVRSGRIHGKMITNGTLTGRASHHSPNLGQIPAEGSFMGSEIRSLFHAPEGYKMVGCDASKLELVCLGHFLSAYDGGLYAKVVATGDIHERNRLAAGLPDRTTAKRYIYAFLYGAGVEKLGSIIDPEASVQKRIQLGTKSKIDLYSKIPALRSLSEAVKWTFRDRGYLIGLDGRRLVPRSEHTALNTLLQSAGAIVMKKATIKTWQLFAENNIEALQLLNVHDENQIATKEPEKAGPLMVQAIEEAGKFFNLRCFLTGEYKVGETWAETH